MRHSSLNAIIKRTLTSVRIPCHLEPSGIVRVDGKRLDGATLIPWSQGRALVWDVTCPNTLTLSYTAMASRDAGSVANEAEKRKRSKYTDLLHHYHFIPIAVETLGPFGQAAREFILKIGRLVAEVTLDPLSSFYLRQRISVAVQCGNATAIVWVR